MKKSQVSPEKPHLTRGSILDDLGFSPSEALEIRVKGELHRDLLQCIHSRDLSQRELANLLEVHQPDVSNLLNGRISKFSMGKLIRFAGKLSLDATITLTQPKAVKLPTVQAGRATRKTTASV